MSEGGAPTVVRILTRLNAGGITLSILTQGIHGIPGWHDIVVAGETEPNEVPMQELIDRLPRPPVWIPDLRRSLSPGADARVVRRLVALLRDIQPDIIETHASKAGTVGRVAAAIHNRRHRGGKRRAGVIHYFHGHVFRGGYFSPAATRVFLGLERGLARFATDLIAVPAAQQREELAREFRVAPYDRFRVVPYGIEIDRLTAGAPEHRAAFRAEVGLAPEDVAVGIVGRLEPVKDHATFLEAAAVAMDRLSAAGGPPVRFLVIGDGDLRAALEAQAAALGLGEAVLFLGHRGDRERFLAGLDVAALSSRNEGYPLALIEAMAFGLPVVSTRAGGVADLVRPGENGLLAPVGDAPGLGEAMAAVIRDPELRSRLGEDARADARRRHDVDAVVSATRGVYDELISNRQR